MGDERIYIELKTVKPEAVYVKGGKGSPQIYPSINTDINDINLERDGLHRTICKYLLSTRKCLKIILDTESEIPEEKQSAAINYLRTALYGIAFEGKFIKPNQIELDIPAIAD